MSGYRHCVTENSVDRQRQFEQALLELMAHMEYGQIAVQQICDRVGLSRKSFYRYFSSKDTCLQALIDHNILDFTDIPVHGAQMKRMLEQFYAYWSHRRDLLDALYRNGCSELLLERAILCAVQEYGMRHYFPEESSYERTVFFISGLFGVLLNWHLGGCQKTPAQLAATLEDFLPQKPRGVF